MKENGKIDFAIVGAQKSSTTYLHHAIAASPNVWMPSGETPLFQPHHYAVDKIYKLIEQAESRKLIGIKRPTYMYDSLVCQRLHLHNNNMKIIIILRDRVQRSISTYFHLMRYGRLPVRDPEEGLPIILAAEEGHVAQQGHTVLTYSFYADAVKTYRQIFGENNVLVLSQDAVKTKDAFSLVSAFLDCEIPYCRTLSGKSFQSAYYNPEAITLLAEAARTESICNEYGIVLQVRRSNSADTATSAAALRRRADALPRLAPPELSAELRASLDAYFETDIREGYALGLPC